MSTGDDIPDRRERCGRLMPVPCGEYDEEHETVCRRCDATAEECMCTREARHWIDFVLCPDGKGEFECMTRPD